MQGSHFAQKDSFLSVEVRLADVFVAEKRRRMAIPYVEVARMRVPGFEVVGMEGD